MKPRKPRKTGQPGKPGKAGKPGPSARRKLRRAAEDRLREAGPVAGSPRFAAESARLLHELQVHQVELEVQNAELEEARERTEVLLERYTDLYDFAPIGYFTVDAHVRILEANLTGSALLGLERSRVLGAHLTRFVSPGAQTAFLAFLARVMAGAASQVREFVLRKQGGATFWANLQGAPCPAPDGEGRGCRVAVSDITALVEAREEAQRVQALTVANRHLKQEIVHRQAVEAELKESQQQQGRLLQESRAMQEQLRQLSHGILQAQEEERKRISRELHDDISQTLVNINVQLETLARSTSVDPAAFRARVLRTQRLVEASVETVREFARELRPSMLDDLGLIPALHSYLKDFSLRTGIRARLATFAGVEKLNNMRRTILYRVAQSALTNVARHAEASEVQVSIRSLPDAVRMDIRDNGRSFDVERVMRTKRNRHLGLLGMRERGEMVGGTLTVLSAAGRGTTVRLQIPCAS